MKLKHFMSCLFVAFLMLIGIGTAQAQGTGQTVTGTVLDEMNEPMIGVTVTIEGTSNGTVTDFDGKFSINLPKGKNTLRVSYIGYETQVVSVKGKSIVINLQPSAQSLNEVVVVGYGTAKKKDLTGSVATIGEKDFNEGLISSPEQLINGKVAGLQVTSGGGSPTAGSTIRIRGGASLNASNDPLIVLDGVPMEVGGSVSGSGNFLSLINPNDIESMTILKDASSTAIYGSRASNGVIIITTKKGKTDKVKINFSTTNSLQSLVKTVDMLSRDEFVNAINTNGTDAQKALLGTANTDWNDQIFKTAFGTDNNLSVAGKIGKALPFRVSLGYYNQDGILDTDNATRYSGNINLSPSFFDDHLKLNISGKGAISKNQFANTSAIWGGATMNPTLPVKSGNSELFGGYTEAADASGTPITGATGNPVAQLYDYESTSTVYRFIGNFDVDYKMHFLPELRVHATLGYDYSEGKGDIYVPNYAFSYKNTGGRDYSYGPQKNYNKLLTAYLNYNKEIESIKTTIDATLGYDYQMWKYTNAFYEETNVAGEVQNTSAATDERHALISYYGRVNLSYDSRYLLTATMRRDGSSRFSEDNRWGTFPSVALAWRISNEKFFKPLSNVMNDLKLRLSYGKTGQQDGIANYSYIPLYTQSQAGAYYMFNGTPIATYRPEGYNSSLKWETTDSYNIGIDFGFLGGRIFGTADYYWRKTKDLLATVPIDAGTYFGKQILTNVGNTESQGVELALTAIPIDSKDFTWTISANATWLKNEITNLSLVEGTEVNTLVGSSVDSQQVQVFTEGYAPYSFYVYKQIYDEKTGKPIEGMYADLNGDGSIDSNDRYHYHSPAPDWIFGLSTSLRYKKWTLSTSLRANLGNYVYNGMAMNTGAWETVSYNAYQLNNLNTSYLATGFTTRQHLSDYYVENASFIKMDNISLGYNFGQITPWCKLNASLMVQNVFTITNYSGIDPEVSGGIDSSVYPRPRIYSLSLGFEF